MHAVLDIKHSHRDPSVLHVCEQLRGTRHTVNRTDVPLAACQCWLVCWNAFVSKPGCWAAPCHHPTVCRLHNLCCDDRANASSMQALLSNIPEAPPCLHPSAMVRVLEYRDQQQRTPLCVAARQNNAAAMDLVRHQPVAHDDSLCTRHMY